MQKTYNAFLMSCILFIIPLYALDRILKLDKDFFKKNNFSQEYKQALEKELQKFNPNDTQLKIFIKEINLETSKQKQEPQKNQNISEAIEDIEDIDARVIPWKILEESIAPKEKNKKIKELAHMLVFTAVLCEKYEYFWRFMYTNLKSKGNTFDDEKFFNFSHEFLQKLIPEMTEQEMNVFMNFSWLEKKNSETKIKTLFQKAKSKAKSFFQKAKSKAKSFLMSYEDKDDAAYEKKIIKQMIKEKINLFFTGEEFKSLVSLWISFLKSITSKKKNISALVTDLRKKQLKELEKNKPEEAKKKKLLQQKEDFLLKNAYYFSDYSDLSPKQPKKSSLKTAEYTIDTQRKIERNLKKVKVTEKEFSFPGQSITQLSEFSIEKYLTIKKLFIFDNNLLRLIFFMGVMYEQLQNEAKGTLGKIIEKVTFTSLATDTIKETVKDIGWEDSSRKEFIDSLYAAYIIKEMILKWLGKKEIIEEKRSIIMNAIKKTAKAGVVIGAASLLANAGLFGIGAGVAAKLTGSAIGKVGSMLGLSVPESIKGWYDLLNNPLGFMWGQTTAKGMSIIMRKYASQVSTKLNFDPYNTINYEEPPSEAAKAATTLLARAGLQSSNYEYYTSTSILKVISDFGIGKVASFSPALGAYFDVSLLSNMLPESMSNFVNSTSYSCAHSLINTLAYKTYLKPEVIKVIRVLPKDISQFCKSKDDCFIADRCNTLIAIKYHENQLRNVKNKLDAEAFNLFGMLPVSKGTLLQGAQMAASWAVSSSVAGQVFDIGKESVVSTLVEKPVKGLFNRIFS